MKPYEFSKLWLMFIRGFNAKKMNKFAYTSALVCILGIVIYEITPNHFVWLVIIPFGFPFMTFVLFRMGIQVFENYRIKKYCRKVGITTNEFNAIYTTGD